MPREIVEEVLAGRDEKDLLLEWMKDNKETFLLQEGIKPDLIQKVIDNGYAPDLTDDEIEQIGNDPFLVAYALNETHRSVVTTEVSAPAKTRQNRKLPDVCSSLDVLCLDTFKFMRDLDFRTSWENS